MLNKQNLIKYFENGIKSNANLKIGTEHEKFILNKDTFLPLKYDEENGINNIFLSLIEICEFFKYHNGCKCQRR